VGAAAFRADRRLFAGDDGVVAVLAIVSWDAMAPPELAGNAPVTDVLHPVEIRLVETLGHKAGLFGFDYFNSWFGQGFHFDKPLERHARFDDSRAAVAGADIMLVRLGFF